jgi:ABC-type proline/glycine betaine transport system permease subunit
LFLKKVEDLFTFEQKSLEKNEEMVSQLLFSLKHPVLLKSLIVASTETTFFIHNECSIMFEELLGLFDITAFDFWKILNAYIAIDPLMPASLKQHLRAIEVKIVQ